MKFILSTLFKNRAWCLPDYLRCLLALQTSGHKVSLLFVDDASTDNTVALLEDFLQQHSDTFPDSLLLKLTDPHEDNTSSRDFTHRQSGLQHIADVRNIVLRAIRRTSCDGWFSMESDVLLFPDCLQRLMACQVDCVSPLLYTDNHIRQGIRWDISWNRYTNGAFDRGGRPENLITGWHCLPDRLREVACGGGVFLLSRRGIETTATYTADIYGDEWHFFQQLGAQGIRRWILQSRLAVHVMLPDYLEEAQQIVYPLLPPVAIITPAVENLAETPITPPVASKPRKRGKAHVATD
jgi:glycosyltransferase involved in cell wall biosynthesis